MRLKKRNLVFAFGNIVKMQQMRQQLVTMVMIATVLILAFILYYFHWKYELPQHPNIDETITLNNIETLLSGKMVTSFNYPHLPYHYGHIMYRIASDFIDIKDITLFMRIVECGFGMLCNIFMYFTVKELTGSRRWGYIGLLFALFSLYQAEFLYYAGPDVLLYGMASIIIFLGVKIYKEDDEKKVFFLWYPLIAICIGLAVSSKYHGILFGLYWLILHVIKKYIRNMKYNVLFCIDCLLIVLVYLLVNYSLVVCFSDFMEGLVFNFSHYKEGHIGLEHNLPLLGYMEVFVIYGFGVVGALLLIIGTIYLLSTRDYRGLMLAMMGVVVVVILTLSRYKLCLGRNISMIMPYACVFMTFGMYALENMGRKHISYRWVYVLAMVMICVNVGAFMISVGYPSSYLCAEEWIRDNIPNGATIYVDDAFYKPYIDEEHYKVVAGYCPEILGQNEYYIRTGYASKRYIQRKDYLLFEGDYMYPEEAERYYNEVERFCNVASFKGITHDREWRYRIGYLDWLRYGKEQYYKGPTIDIYATINETN